MGGSGDAEQSRLARELHPVTSSMAFDNWTDHQIHRWSSMQLGRLVKMLTDTDIANEEEYW